jgi:hypothetical protein
MLTWGPRALLGRSKLPVAGETCDVDLRQSLPSVVRCEDAWGNWLRASQIACLENSHFSRLNSSTGQVIAGDA